VTADRRKIPSWIDSEKRNFLQGNMNWFSNLADAKETIEEWRDEYNEVRPHSSLEKATPNAFATKIKEQNPTANPLLKLV